MGILKSKSVVIYGVFEDIVALLNKGEMKTANETATLITFTKLATSDQGPKIPRLVKTINYISRDYSGFVIIIFSVFLFFQCRA